MKTSLNSLIGLTLLAAGTSQASAADLNVVVDAVRSGKGQVKLMLFEREEGFRREDRARQVLVVPAQTGAVTSVFRDLPPGRYAVIAYHDENANNKLDMKFGMFPKEGYGLSNNYIPSGPPKFNAAAFEVMVAGASSMIRLVY